jgi:hypothetical protein
MRRTFVPLLVGALVIASMLSATVTAQATPGKSKRCSSCHTATTAMTISIKKTATNTYRVSVAGAKGVGIFSGTTKVKGVRGRTVTFRTVKGRKYTVYGVNGYRKGYKAKSFIAR